MPYTDIIRRLKDAFGLPIAAYNISGEYAMLTAALDGEEMVDGPKDNFRFILRSR